MCDKLDGKRKRVQDLRASLAEAKDWGVRRNIQRWLSEAEQDLAWELHRRGMLETGSGPAVEGRTAQDRG